jgi:hypothetical protein
MQGGRQARDAACAGSLHWDISGLLISRLLLSAQYAGFLAVHLTLCHFASTYSSVHP